MAQIAAAHNAVRVPCMRRSTSNSATTQSTDAIDENARAATSDSPNAVRHARSSIGYSAASALPRAVKYWLEVPKKIFSARMGGTSRVASASQLNLRSSSGSCERRP